MTPNEATSLILLVLGGIFIFLFVTSAILFFIDRLIMVVSWIMQLGTAVCLFTWGQQFLMKLIVKTTAIDLTMNLGTSEAPVFATVAFVIVLFGLVAYIISQWVALQMLDRRLLMIREQIRQPTQK